MDYLLYRLSVNEIKNYCAVKANGSYETVKVDLNNRFVFDAVVLSRDEMGENAFVYQALKTIYGDTMPNDDEVLLNQIIIMDFSYSLNSEVAKGFDKHILDGGLDLVFQDNVQRHFIAMDKSGSMSKESKILYVFDELAENLFPRLMLGLTEMEAKAYNIQTNASKLYAYRGLYLTDSVRIMTELSEGPTAIDSTKKKDIIKLNSETVLFLDDERGVDVDWKIDGKYDFLSKKSDFITAESDGETDQDNKLIWTLRVKSKDFHLSPFDGEGLICPEYADIINRQMKIPMSNNQAVTDVNDKKYRLGATSFQIRLPFCKGMLHTLSWKKLIMDQIQDMNLDIKYEDLYIRDIYDCWRKLDKVKIILTCSMFKCNEWWKQYCGSKGVTDKVEYYFSQMKEYDHSLYISQTNYLYPNVGKTLLNYQFLNPLSISKDELDLLLKEQEKLIRSLQDDPLNSLIDIYASETTEDFETEESVFIRQKRQTVEARTLLLKALLSNINFVKDPYIRNKLGDCQLQMIKDIFKGRFCVDGQLRYLSGDLLALTAVIVDRCKIGSESDGNTKSSKIRNLTSHILQNRLTHDKETKIDQFYLPQSKIIRPSQEKYALLRNPHLSRYEESLVAKIKGYKLTFYKKNFDHLAGIIMVGCRSVVPNIVGGADFDGDIVRIISDTHVVDAVERGILGNCTAESRIPFIRIPNPTNALLRTSIQHPIKKSIDSEIILRTFSNKVGHISNMAVRFGEIEYSTELEGHKGVLRIKDKSKDPELVGYEESLSAEGCILTGLELDANKNGFHPSLNKYEQAGKILEDYRKGTKKADYLKMKEKLEQYDFRKIVFYKKEDRFIISNPKGGRNYVILKPEGENGIINLPWECLNTYDQIRKPFMNNGPRSFMVNQKLYRKAKNAKLFWFERNELNYTDEIKSNLKKIVSAYNKVTEEAGKRYQAIKAFKEARYFSRIRVILTLQYGDLTKPFYMDESRTVEMVALDAYNQLNSYLESSQEERESFMEKLMNGWMFSSEEERRDLLTGITADESVVGLLSNFNSRGFYLLYYIAKHIYLSYKERDDIEKVWSELIYDKPFGDGPEDTASTTKNRYIAEYRKLYHMSFIYKDDEYKWKRELIYKCREDIMDLFCEGSFLKYESEMSKKLSVDEKKIDAAIACLNLMRNAETPVDVDGRFFWRIFQWEEIQRNLLGISKEVSYAERSL